MRLTYVESEETYSLYLDRDGEEVYLAHGTGFRRLVFFETVDLAASWADYRRTTHGMFRQGWLQALAESVVDPDEVDDVRWCKDCEAVLHTDDTWDVNGGVVCESCHEDYSCCDRCERSVRHTTTTLHNSEVCEPCRNDYWSFCESCDGWYRDEDSDEHCHGSGGCDCESPAQEFSVRNDGEAPLGNDERVTIALPAGVISQEGMLQIDTFLRSTASEMSREDDDDWRHLYYCAAELEEVGPTWQTERGNFTKRLSRYAYEKYKLKLAPAVLSQVGCIARDHSTGVQFHVEITRDLNLSAEDFGNEDSCWWGSYGESRCALKSNGGFGLRSFDEEEGGWVSGRAWVQPLKGSGDRLTPTFDTNTNAFVVFNGYGELSGYVPARIVAHMAGLTYRKIGFTCTPMYVNGDSGYLVASEEIVQAFTDRHLSLYLNTHATLHHSEMENVSAA